LAAFGVQAEAPGAQASKVQWSEWTDQLFAQAAKEKRLILLDLEAVWCHWCHGTSGTTLLQDREE